MRVPISLKLIVLVVGSLVATTAYFAHQTAQEFSEVLTTRERFEVARHTQAKGKEVEALLSQLVKRTVVVSSQALQQASPQNFVPDPGLVALRVFEQKNGRIAAIWKWVNEEHLRENQVTTQKLEDMHRIYPFPLRSMVQGKVEIRNSTLPMGLPLFSLGVPIRLAESGEVSHLAVADYELGILQKVFSDATDQSRASFLVDRQGITLAHSQEDLALRRTLQQQHPLYARAVAPDSLQNLQIQFESSEKMIGAFSKVSNDLFEVYVMTEVPEAKVLEPAENVKRESVRIAGQVIAVAFFLSFLFALSLSSPIEILASLIQAVSRGQFNIKARKLVNSHDEVGDLAVAFDKMTEGLKERDKVKSLFSKFHGSSIAEDLIKNSVGRRGDKKKVTVFFSDIRGFTAFSESVAPEEVVAMLNEYFAVMVSIINRNNGVVDKFIGDAIMAVWGVPKEGANDTENAVRACLEMRKALVALNEKRAQKGKAPILIGMGLHTGVAISGTIGSEERMEYTVIGDTVNLTSRIEGATKAFGTDLLVSEDVVKALESVLKTEFAGVAEAKGKSEPIRLFKVLGMRNARGEMEEVITTYSQYQAEKSEKIKVA